MVSLVQVLGQAAGGRILNIFLKTRTRGPTPPRPRTQQTHTHTYTRPPTTTATTTTIIRFRMFRERASAAESLWFVIWFLYFEGVCIFLAQFQHIWGWGSTFGRQIRICLNWWSWFAMTFVIVHHWVGRKRMRHIIYNMFHLLSMLYGLSWMFWNSWTLLRGRSACGSACALLQFISLFFMSFVIKKRRNIYGRNNAFSRILMIVSFKFVKYGGAKTV